MTKRLLVVGTGGFLARHALARLGRGHDFELITAGRSEPTVVDSDRHHEVNCGELDRVHQLVLDEAPDAILNLVGSTSAEFDDLLRFNVNLPEALLSAASQVEKERPVRVVLIGSAAEFGIPEDGAIDEKSPLKPENEYGLSKVMQSDLAEFYRRRHGERVSVTTAKIFNLLGAGLPSRLVFGSFTEQIAAMVKGGSLMVGNLDTERDFLHVDDAVEALLCLLGLDEVEPGYVVASGQPKRIRDLLDYLIEVSGEEVKVEIDHSRFRPVDVPSIHGDSSLLRKYTGWTPALTPELALEDMWRYANELR